MKAVEFPGCNVVFAKDQPEYLPLPAMRLEDGLVITCFELTEDELKRVIESKRIYFTQLTFNKPLQPIMPVTDLSDLIEMK